MKFLLEYLAPRGPQFALLNWGKDMIDKKLATLLLVVFIDIIGFGVAIPILPLLIENVGGSVILVGAAISVFSLFQFLFSPILGRLSDKYGRRPILMVTSVINALSYLLIFVWHDLWMIFLARTIAGIASANISVAQAYIADTSENHERTKKMGLFGAAFGLGFIVGPVIGGLTSSAFSLSTPFLVPAILSIINAVLIYFVLPESNKALQKKIKIEFFNMRVTREVMRPKNIAFLLFVFFFANFALSLIIGVFPLFSQEKFGWGEAQNGMYFAIIGMGSFITQAYLVRLLLKKFVEAKILRLALGVFGVSVAAVGLAPTGLITYIIGPFTSFGFSLINLTTQSLISLESKPEEQGLVLGVAQSFGSLARTIGPLIGGLIATIDLSLPYIVAGLISILILIFGNNYLRKMKLTG